MDVYVSYVPSTTHQMTFTLLPFKLSGDGRGKFSAKKEPWKLSKGKPEAENQIKFMIDI